MAEYRAVCKTYRAEKQALAAINAQISNLNDARTLTQDVAQQVQQQAHSQIAGVVSRCLETVFDQPYKFIIHFERKRGRTEARLSFEREGLEVDPMTASGGGVIDVAAFALRLACLMLSSPPLRKVLILDEPFKFVSEEYRENIVSLLQTLSTEMGVQFIFVTHIDELKTGKVIQLS